MGDYTGFSLQVSLSCLLSTLLFIISMSHGLTPSNYVVGVKNFDSKPGSEFVDVRIVKGHEQHPESLEKEIGLPMRVKSDTTGLYQISGEKYEPHVMCLEVRDQSSKVTTILVNPLPNKEKSLEDNTNGYKYSLFGIDGDNITHSFSYAPYIVRRRLKFLCSLTDPDHEKPCNMPRDWKPSVPFQTEVQLQIENSFEMEDYLRWMYKESDEKFLKTFSTELILELKNSRRQLIETILLKPGESTSSKWFSDNGGKLATASFYEFQNFPQYAVEVRAKTSGDLLFTEYHPSEILQAPSTATLKLVDNLISWDISYHGPKILTDRHKSYFIHGVTSEASIPRSIPICKLPFKVASHDGRDDILCASEREDIHPLYFGIMVKGFTTGPTLWKLKVEVRVKDKHNGAVTLAPHGSQFEVQQGEMVKRWIWYNITKEFNRMLSVHVSKHEEGKQPIRLLNYTPLTKYKSRPAMIEDGLKDYLRSYGLTGHAPPPPPHGKLPFKGYRNLMLIFHNDGVYERKLGPNCFRQGGPFTSIVSSLCKYYGEP